MVNWSTSLARSSSSRLTASSSSEAVRARAFSLSAAALRNSEQAVMQGQQCCTVLRC